MAIPLVAGATLKRQSIESRLQQGYLDATTLMEELIKQGIPQRTAHHTIGQLVGRAMELGVPLAELSLEEFQKLCPQLDDNVYGVLGVENAVKAFTSQGSTAPSEVARQLQRWQQLLAD
jgi:argininosuccinate lyase